MITFLDENDVEYGALATIKATNAVNGERSITGTIVSGDYVLSKIERGWRLRFDDEYYVVTYAKPIDEGKNVQVSFDAVHQFFWDFGKSSVYDQLNDGSHTFRAYLDFIFNDSGYRYDIESSLTVKAFEKQSFGYKNRLSLFNDIITSSGVEFQVNGKVVRILAKVGTDLSTVVRKNFNLNELGIEKNISNFVTYQKGFGAYFDEEDHSKGRLVAEYTSPLASVYGKLEADPLVDERYKQPESLLSALKETVDNSYTISVSLDMEDLTRAGYRYTQPVAGDYIMAINETLGFKEKIRIVSFTSEYDVAGQLIKHTVTCNDIGSVKKLSASYTHTQHQAANAEVNANTAYEFANKALVSANGKNTNYYGDTFPVDNPKGTLKKGDLLFLTVGDTVKQYYWNGAEWVTNPVVSDVEAFKEQISEELKDVPNREEFENKIAEELATSKAEIETQIETAKTQAESNAKEYADTINQETAKVAELANAAAGEIKADLVNVKNNLTATSLVANNAQAAVDAAKQELAEVNTKVDNAKSELTQTKQDLTNVASELNTAKQELADSVTAVNIKVDNAKADLTQAKQQITTVADDLSKAKTDFQNAVNAVDTKATNLKSDLTQAKQDLASQAQQLQEQAGAQSELTNRVSSVEKTANGTKTTVNELSKTVAQNGKDITSVTARTKVVEDDLAGTKTTLSQVQTTADSTSQKTATLETGLNGLSAKFDNLRVGGRNLLSKTNQGKTKWSWKISSGGTTAEDYNADGVNAVKLTRTSDASFRWDYIQYDGLIRKLIEPNTKYTLSFDVKPSVDVTFSASLQRGDGGALLTNAASMNKATANKWTKVSCVLTSKTTLPDDLSQVVYLSGMPVGNGNWLIIKNIKLEKGNIVTDYSPSEVDLEQKVAEYKQTADQNYASLQTTVQNLDGTVQHNKTTAEQTAAGFKTRIESLETYKDGESERANAYFESAKTETAKQLTAERTAIAKDYVAKSTYTSDVTGIRNDLTATTTTANTIKTNLANYQASNDRAVANLQSNIQTANGDISSLKTKVEAVPGQITSAVSAVEGKIPTNVSTRNLILKSNDFAKPHKQNGINTTITSTDDYFVIKSTGYTANAWGGMSWNMSISEVKAGEQFSILMPVYIDSSIALDGAFGFNIKNHPLNLAAYGYDIPTNKKDQWFNVAITFKASKDVVFDTYPFYVFLVKNGLVRIKPPMLVRGNLIPSDYQPAFEDTESDINAVSSEIKQTADGMTLLATKTELNSAKTELQSGINTATNKANAAQSTANNNAQTISTHTTQISALNTGLQAKVSQTDFNTLSGRVTTAENNITAKANELSSKITSVEGKIPSGEMNLVEYGRPVDGYNRYAGAEYAKHGFYYNGAFKMYIIKNTATSEKIFGMNRFKVERNTDYTLYFKGFNNSAITNMDVFFLKRVSGSKNDYDSAQQLVVGRKLSTSRAEDVSVTFNTGNYDEGYIRFDNNGSTTAGTEAVLFFGDVSIKKGKSNNGWSPSFAELASSQDLKTTQSELKQTKDGITLLATKTELNTAKNELQSGISTATNKANAAQSTANNNAQTINTHTTQISALNTGLQAKVSQTEFNTLSGRVTSAENNITAKANELSSKITSVEGKIPTSVGGRNYIKDSEYRKANIYVNDNQSQDEAFNISPAFWQNSNVYNKKIKLSFYYQASAAYGTERKFPVYFRESPWPWIGEVTYPANTTRPIKYTMAMSNTLPANFTAPQIFIRFTGNLDKGRDHIITKVMLEVSDVFSDWSPAPEDTIEEISSLSSELKQTKDGITLLATKTELNTAKNELQSGISTATNKANAAQNTANNNAQTISTHTTQISALNTGLQAKVSQTEFNTLSGRVTSAENNITAKANELSSKITSVEGKIPSGEMNLVEYGRPADGYSPYAGAEYTTHGFYYNGAFKMYIIRNKATSEKTFGMNRFKVERNTEYTLYFKGFNNSAITNMDVWFLKRVNGSKNDYDSAQQLVVGRKLSTGFAEDISVTFNTGNYDEGYIRFDNNGSTTAGTEAVLFFGDVSIKKGKSNNGWSPSLAELASSQDLKSAQSEIKQTKDGMTLLATKTELNTAKNELQSGITTATNKANSNAQTISTHTTQISALNTGLQAKVSQSDFNTLSGRVTTAENNITAKANELSSKITSVEGKIPKSLGGRNLIIRSQIQNGYIDNTGNFVSSNDHFTTGFIDATNNKQFTITAPKNGGALLEWLRLAKYDANKNFLGRDLISYTKDTKTVKTITLADNVSYFKISFDGVYGDPFKIERGNIATDWSPAPEDYDSKLATAQSEIKQTTDAIKASVSSVQTAASNAQSTANTAVSKADAAQAGVNTLDSTTVKTASLTINTDGVVIKAGKSTSDFANAIGSYFSVNQNAINLFSDKINVKGSMIVSGAITSDKIASKSINTAHLNGKIITADVISSNAVTAGAIKAGAVTTDKMSANSINGDRITAGTLDAAKIKAGSITASQIASGTITSAQIKTGTISAANIASGAITSDKIAANSIDASKIAANAITANMIRGGQLNSTNGATSFDLNAGTLTFNNNYGYIQRVASDKVFEITTLLGKDTNSRDYLTSAFNIRKSDSSRRAGVKFTLYNTIADKPTAEAKMNADAFLLHDSKDTRLFSVYGRSTFMGTFNMQDWGDIPVANIDGGLIVKDIGLRGHTESLLKVVETLCKKTNTMWL